MDLLFEKKKKKIIGYNMEISLLIKERVWGYRSTYGCLPRLKSEREFARACKSSCCARLPTICLK